ncbi:sperm-associated antigen 7 homolog isoform X2 [Nilaparvata lugens]|nr:sperm-associated antigen 7 homolog isoform X2 [Nilaparvata lugens]
MIRMRSEEKEKFCKFRRKVEERINLFQKDENEKRLKFEPMDHVFRGIIHDVAEIAGMTAYSFGAEGYDRHTMVYKRDYPPCDDEIATLRNGEEWNEEKAKELAEKRKLAEKAKAAEECAKKSKRKARPRKIIPKTNYQIKYQHLIGTEVAKDAARVTQTNKSYGFVPSENKKDIRSIEQTLADIKSKKRQKLDNPNSSAAGSPDY